MQKDIYIDILVDNSKAVSQKEALSTVSTAFEFDAITKILIAKSEIASQSMFADKKLRKAALFAPNRAYLKKLIHQHHKPLKIEKIEDFTFLDAHFKDKLIDEITEIPVNPTRENSEFEVEKDTYLTQIVNDKIINNGTQITVNPSTRNSEFEVEKEAFLTQLANDHVLVTNDSFTEENQFSENETYKQTNAEADISVDLIPTNEFNFLENTNIEEQNIESPKEEFLRFESKFYVHISTFGHTPKASKVDAVDEFLAYRIQQETEKATPDVQQLIIQKFLEDEPVINRLSNNFVETNKTDLSKTSTMPSEFITENYANILIKQKKYDKAIEIYNKLILKNPEKETYFADKIILIQSYHSL